MNAFQTEEAAREIADVNVVPLADVSLVLLIILLVLSPMMAQSSMRVKAAASGSEPSSSSPIPSATVPARANVVLVVGLDEHGLTLDGKSYDEPGALMAALKDALAGREDRKVFLAPGPETPHGLVVHTIETIKSCGAESVALVQTQEGAK